MSKYIMGAYACAPSFHYLNAEDEKAFFALLKNNNDLKGFEIPFLESFHPLGSDFLFENIKDEHVIAITAIMYTMGRRSQDKSFGLASSDENSRLLALKHIEKIFDNIKKVNDKYGFNRFISLQIQSALDNSSNIDANKKAFAKSLKAIAQMNDNIDIFIEHCDAYNGINVRKGFLDLDSEIELSCEHNFGICLNYARSYLETNSHQGVLLHINKVKEAQLPLSFIFSGTATGGAYGNLQDNHAPFAPFDKCSITCPESILTIEKAHECIQAIDNYKLSYLGAKLLEIDKDAKVQHRADLILDALCALNKAQEF